MPEVAITVLSLAIALALLVRLGRDERGGRGRWVLAIGSGYAALIGFAVARRPPQGRRAELPRRSARDGYATSSRCRSCHPSEYSSWHRSFHRSMTQIASPSAIAAPFAAAHFELDGRSYDVQPRKDRLWVRMPDPDVMARLAVRSKLRLTHAVRVPEVMRPIVMTTGSHHYQAYWVPGGRGNELRLFPFVYLLGDRRWAPRRDVFVEPPDAPEIPTRWNSNCIQCHAVAGRPELDPVRDVFESESVELGIACESCHGPAEAHVREMQNPVARYFGDKDPRVVNPARLPPRAQSEICGQCHAYFVPVDEEEWWTDGFAARHRAGVPLARSRHILRYADRFENAGLIETSFDNLFWTDGTIRIGGREYNGLIESPCYRFGKGERTLSCLSCHSLHQSEPNDQLADGKGGNAACTGCHAKVAHDVPAHTHHAPGSSGSLCYSCHMPYTTYALLKGIRAHRITSPDVEEAARTGRPDACNLCHLDKTLAWTSERLHAWYGLGPARLSERNVRVSSALATLLTGDAAQRAIVAYNMGLSAARAASGGGWPARYLIELLDDPYSAVRYIAARSLRAQPGFGGFDFDFVAAPDQRRARIRKARARWEALARRRGVPHDRALLFDDSGRVMLPELERLLSERNDRVVVLSE